MLTILGLLGYLGIVAIIGAAIRSVMRSTATEAGIRAHTIEVIQSQGGWLVTDEPHAC